MHRTFDRDRKKPESKMTTSISKLLSIHGEDSEKETRRRISCMSSNFQCLGLLSEERNRREVGEMIPYRNDSRSHPWFLHIGKNFSEKYISKMTERTVVQHHIFVLQALLSMPRLPMSLTT